MKVLLADPIAKTAITNLEECGVEVDDLSSLPKEELIHKVREYDCMVVRSATKVRKEMIDNMDKMKLIIRGGVGIDNIDVSYAEEKGIKVMNTPAASSISVAEIVFAHMLALSRHIVKGTVGIKEGKWEKKVLKGVELFGKTLGIIGLGRIGKELAKRGKALGMKVIAYDPYVEVEGVDMVGLDELLRDSDYISVHTPLTDKTKHLIGRNELKKMKKGAILVNCARGGIVDENALIEALREGEIAGVGLDVYEVEPPKVSELMGFSNVTFTPHIGASTKQAQERIAEEVVKIIKNELQ
ncbi:3-phosphoglycerate dehydrogenase [candidate division WOR-3 bacterium JGI_Cruoil_03_44_89]|uniref:3-phosphoglycerate dehydrogenase n=1 Tax=candidate division WOR-3 bacterium JGI_Cruoil_03_44_89 TaxID=1973748 RepID=A0A235BVF2_UNCW3|nr:MAG: 3-phosphoglycerate dehydrogenase [candidate division WOR-3 bacterium JGI_Cruoil_03_44_89]